IPKTIKAKPITLFVVIGSPNQNTEIIKTNTNAKLINGYAKLMSNLVMAAIQNKDATNADKNPDKISGSKRSRKINCNLANKSAGKSPYLSIRHFSMICP